MKIIGRLDFLQSKKPSIQERRLNPKNYSIGKNNFPEKQVGFNFSNLYSEDFSLLV